MRQKPECHWRYITPQTRLQWGGFGRLGCLGGAALRSIFGGQSQQCGLAKRAAAQAVEQTLRVGFQLLVCIFGKLRSVIPLTRELADIIAGSIQEATSATISATSSASSADQLQADIEGRLTSTSADSQARLVSG